MNGFAPHWQAAMLLRCYGWRVSARPHNDAHALILAPPRGRAVAFVAPTLAECVAAGLAWVGAQIEEARR